MSLAVFRKSEQQDELTKLASEHIRSDLEPSDRTALRKATARVATATTVGSLVGLGLGVYASIRLRKVRTDVFAAFRAAEKPSSVLFANGRQGKQSPNHALLLGGIHDKQVDFEATGEETANRILIDI